MKRFSILLLATIVFLMSIVPVFAKETEKPVNQEIVNLRSFAKLYGYVRFFHPSDENEKVDWTRFAIHGVSKVKTAKSNEELTTTLRELFYPIAPTMQLTKQDRITQLKPPKQALNLTAWQHQGVKMNSPELDMLYKSERLQSEDLKEIKLMKHVLQPGETVIKQLAPKLFAHIPLVLYRDSKGTIGETTKSTQEFEKLQQQLTLIDLNKISIDDKNVQLANIVITWNVLQHFYPYFDVVKVDWEQVLTDTLLQSLNDITADQFVQTMKQMLEKTQDGHSGIFDIKNQMNQVYLPLRVQWIEDQVIITNVKSDIDLKPGDIIVHINGQSATNYYKQLEKSIAGSEQWKRYVASIEFLKGKAGTEAKLTVLRDKHKFEISIPYSNKNIKEVDEFIRPASIDKIADDIFYINLMEVTMDELNKRLKELENAKGIIFDVRGYPNFGKHQVLSHLTDVPVQFPQLHIPIYVYPDQEKVDFNLEQVSLNPLQPRLKAKIVFLTYGGAISYTEWLLGIVEHHQLGEIVGETTAGTNGNANTILLPGGYMIPWTGAKILKQDGSQHHLVGIQPTIPVKRTIKEVREGRDVYMEKAIEIINAAKSNP